jgi:ferric-dicitrate binding protein FerR (iron transport regulator)
MAKEERIRRLLDALPRREGPAALDAILTRWRAEERRSRALGVVGVAAALLLAVVAWSGLSETPAPVHLQIEVVDIESLAPPTPDFPGAAIGHGAEEFDNP